MKLMQRKNKWITRLLLVAALFAQEALAAHLCVLPATSAKQAYLAASDAAPMQCHLSKNSTSNACLMHCTQAEQVGMDDSSVLAMPAADVILHVATPPVPQLALASRSTPLVLSTGPPLSIRFCCFLI